MMITTLVLISSDDGCDCTTGVYHTDVICDDHDSCDHKESILLSLVMTMINILLATAALLEATTMVLTVMIMTPVR